MCMFIIRFIVCGSIDIRFICDSIDCYFYFDYYNYGCGIVLQVRQGVEVVYYVIEIIQYDIILIKFRKQCFCSVSFWLEKKCCFDIVLNIVKLI